MKMEKKLSSLVLLPIFLVVESFCNIKMRLYTKVSNPVFRMPKEWSYRGEGNCNIVLSLPQSRKILRVRKTEKPTSILGWILVLLTDLFYWYYGRGLQDELRDLNFYMKVMRPLLGEEYTCEAKQIILTRKQVQIFKNDLSKIRPEFRQNKTLQYGRAAVFDDFAFLPPQFDNLPCEEDTFSVEIKPKQGWRPLKEQMLPHCFFCLNQYLKLEKRQIKCRTNYCPEDLFSGDKAKMKLSLKRLFEMPQNNFKIFKNGSLCYDEKKKSTSILHEIFNTEDSDEILIEELCDFLQKCLITNLTSQINTTVCNCDGINSSRKLTQQNDLPKGSVLERILSIQMLDNEGSHSTYKKLSKFDMWDEWSFVEKILEKVNNNSENVCVRCCILEESKKGQNELVFVPYLISAIAKDCSFMVTFRRLKTNLGENTPNSKNIFKTSYGDFVVSIGIFDLYPKPLSTVKKHYKRNKDMLKAFRKVESE